MCVYVCVIQAQVEYYLFKKTGDEESPAEVTQQDAESLGSAEGMKLVSEEHAEDWVLIFSPLAEVAPSLQRQKKAKSSGLSGVRARMYNPAYLER